jgi:hypothetical protein
MDVEVDERRLRLGHGTPILDPAQDRTGRPSRRASSGPGETIYRDVFWFSLVLFVLVALGAASFFRHMLAAFLVLLALPVIVLLHTLIGTFYAVFAVAAFAIFVALIQTITSSLALLREANAAPAGRLGRAQPHRSARGSNRSRIAA